MTARLQNLLNFIWYKDNLIGLCLLPISMLFNDIVRFRRYLYKIGLLKKQKLPIPVIVVGNITVGGTGKTPLTLYLAQLLEQTGYNPGIICRGYGGQSEQWPQQVTEQSDPKQIGDEPLLLARRTKKPVAVGPDRVEAARLLLRNTNCDILISDDGLQHYSLERDIEIIVIDGDRRFGNGYSLPSGPLRESISRITEVNLLVCNNNQPEENEFLMTVSGTHAINLVTSETKPLEDFKELYCHALAGMGNPERFFSMLKDLGISFKPHSFPDHHNFLPEDLLFADDQVVLMTEKDAVKCSDFGKSNFWYVQVSAILPEAFNEKLLKLLKEKTDGY